MRSSGQIGALLSHPPSSDALALACPHRAELVLQLSGLDDSETHRPALLRSCILTGSPGITRHMQRRSLKKCQPHDLV